MWGHRYFGRAFWGNRYWGDGGSVPPPPVVEEEQQTRGFYQYDQSKRRERKDEGLRDELVRLYEGIKESPVPAVVAPIVERLQEIRAVPVRKRKTLPAVASVDWGKVVADEVAVELIRRWDDLLREDEQILLMGD